MISSRKGGVALRGAVEGPRYASERYGEVAYLDHAATLDGSRLRVFAINRSLDDAMALRVSCADRPIVGVVDAELLHAGYLDAENTFENPAAVQAVPFDGWGIDRGGTFVTLPPHAFAAATFELG